MDVTPACADGEYESVAPTPTSDRGCATLNVCPTCDGSDCWQDLPSCNSVNGALDIRLSTGNTVASSLLTYIDGYLSIQASSILATINLPSLTYTGGHIFISNNDVLATINLYSLTYTGQDLIIWSNAVLSAISFPSIAYITERLLISLNMNLATIDLPSLIYIGGSSESLVIDSNAALTTINLPSMAFTMNVEIRSNAALSTINIPSLTYTQSLTISNNAVLATINLSSLSTLVGSLTIYVNPSLTHASLPKLTYIASIIFICQNNADFVIPSGPPDAPTGGLVVTGPLKNTESCYFQQGADTCTTVTCP
jgi:hypothetical protein